MRTLLIIGSKPHPKLPPSSAYQEVACSNASGYSAEIHHLPRPVFTVMTSVIACDIESGKQSLKAINGLSTGTVYMLCRRDAGWNSIASLSHYLKTFKKKPIHRMQPFYLQRKLKSVRYKYNNFVALYSQEYDTLVERLCDNDKKVCSQLQRKRPSTGVIALALAIDQRIYNRYILCGFNFELTHSYGVNPVIEIRGTPVSSHAKTDAMVFGYLAKKLTNIFTTEKAVHNCSGVPLLV